MINILSSVSVYSQGGKTSAGLYYRFYQYLSKMNCRTRYNKQLPDCLYKRYMPIAYQPLIIKGLLYILIVIRVTIQLIRDVIFTPNVIIISRTLLNRRFPYFYRVLLKSIKRKGTKIIWDFDDNIFIREIRKSDFYFFSKISDDIFVASPFLKDILPEESKHKVFLLPTTDGTMMNLYNIDVERNRIASYVTNINLIWVGTASGVCQVREIVSHIEKAANIIKEFGKTINLYVVSNRQLDYVPINFNLYNIQWSREVAVEIFLKGHIGLMPLYTTEFEKGKGGFKLIQYLSVGLPSIATAIGINNNILTPECGSLIETLEDEKWSKEIVTLARDFNKWQDMSIKARERFFQMFSPDCNLKIFKESIEKNV